MKTPKGLQPLLDDGMIDSVVRNLKSGKEASVYIVSCGGRLRPSPTSSMKACC